MDLPAFLFTLRWLVRDTFRQSLHSGIFGLMLGVSGLCIVLCLSIGVTGGLAPFQPGETREFLPAGDPQANNPDIHSRHGVDVPRGELTFAFGAIRVPLNRYRDQIVHFLELLLAGGVADAAGILLTLMWTAGFLPGFLEPSMASVLMAKPVPRWLLLVGKFVGVLAFVLFQAAVFVGGTWVALGVRTGVWDVPYLWSIVMLVFHFAAFFGFSVLLAVWTRSTMACVFGSLVFWFACWGVNYERLALQTLSAGAGPGPVVAGVVEAGYWVLPKPADFSFLLVDALDAGNYFGRFIDVAALKEAELFRPELSVATALIFIGATLALAVQRLARTDY